MMLRPPGVQRRITLIPRMPNSRRRDGCRAPTTPFRNHIMDPDGLADARFRKPAQARASPAGACARPVSSTIPQASEPGCASPAASSFLSRTASRLIGAAVALARAAKQMLVSVASFAAEAASFKSATSRDKGITFKRLGRLAQNWMMQWASWYDYVVAMTSKVCDIVRYMARTASSVFNGERASTAKTAWSG